MSNLYIICFLILTVAFLYSSVGHGGASGYLALLAVCGISAAIMKPTALVLNIAVSGISFAQFAREKYFKWELTWPFLITSIPGSFLGALIKVNDSDYKKILAVVLIFPILRLIGLFGEKENKTDFNLLIAIFTGALIGILSGMLGIGGGIILSPILLLLGWATIKETAATSALFIFLNSIAGMAAMFIKNELIITTELNYFILFGIAGGITGAYYGSKKINTQSLKRILALVLAIACFKLIIA